MKFKVMQFKTKEIQTLYPAVFKFLASDFSHLARSLQEDISEIDACFAVGAYKATLILAGSILEAFLLDWLSEKDGKNYFIEPYRIRETDKRGRIKWKEKNDLCTYIEQIADIERPKWMQSKEKAHFIRNRRNSVHAKVCLREDIKIDADTCRTVIEYLKDIIETRIENRRKEIGI